jgi:chaperonin GroES|tara:strand:+ start:4832 stop:5200 length:369 start_codon:yes stop_codon:yes gene_type:complete
MYSANKEVNESVANKIPVPAGYKLLIKPLEVKEKTDAGIYMPDALKNAEQTASVIGFVVKAGPDAYQDESKFPNGPYCKEGDFVIFRSYSGTRFKIDKQEFRLINDDTVEAVVDDPRGYARV